MSHHQVNPQLSGDAGSQARVPRLSTYVASVKQIDECVSACVSEVIISHQNLARLGTLDSLALTELATYAKACGLKTSLEWDILMCEPEFHQAVRVLKELNFENFDSIRVQDPGAYEYALNGLAVDNSSVKKLGVHFVLETGNHNLEAILKWQNYGLLNCGLPNEGSKVQNGLKSAGPIASAQSKVNLERLVLSIELTEASLTEIIANLQVEVELLGLGPILLLYTPRHLLRYQVVAPNAATLFATAECEENSHKGFRIIDNQNGTFVFHEKDYCLIDRVSALMRMNCSVLRVDLRQQDSSAVPDYLGQISEICEAEKTQVGHQLTRASEGLAEAFKASYPTKVLRCFFQANATDVLLKHLKNKNIERKDEGYLGRVVDSTKGLYTIVCLEGNNAQLRVGDRVTLVSPAGTSKEIEISSLKNIEGVQVDEVSASRNSQEGADCDLSDGHEYAVLPFVKGVLPETMVYSV